MTRRAWMVAPMLMVGVLWMPASTPARADEPAPEVEFLDLTLALAQAEKQPRPILAIVLDGV